MEFNSTYGLRINHSLQGETFYIIPLTWKLGYSNIDILKIRIAQWKPKGDRTNQALFYFDVDSIEKVDEILHRFNDFEFKVIEERFDVLFDQNNVRQKNTGEIGKWLLCIIPLLRNEFKLKIITTQV